ncbi:MAG: CopD family protein [Cellvibrionaceae bacterium]
MPWLLLLHITALLCWCASLLYLPALIVSTARREEAGEKGLFFVTRRVFTLIATPAALIAIISGTAIFIVDRTIEVWLVAKLTLVSGLVLCHVATGGLTLTVTQRSANYQLLFCTAVGVTSVVLIAGILWLVLAKPF